MESDTFRGFSDVVRAAKTRPVSCSKLSVSCQPVFDFEAFERCVASHACFDNWIAQRAAQSDLDDSVTSFIQEHNIDFGFVKAAERERCKTRMRHFRQFARQLIALRRIGIVHSQTRDNRGMGLFLLNSHNNGRRLNERQLLAELCAIGAQFAPSMWRTRSPKVVAEMQCLNLRFAIARTDTGSEAAVLVGPLGWINHSPRSGVAFAVVHGDDDLLMRLSPNQSMVFDAPGFDDRRELRIQFNGHCDHAIDSDDNDNDDEMTSTSI